MYRRTVVLRATQNDKWHCEIMHSEHEQITALVSAKKVHEHAHAKRIPKWKQIISHYVSEQEICLFFCPSCVCVCVVVMAIGQRVESNRHAPAKNMGKTTFSERTELGWQGKFDICIEVQVLWSSQLQEPFNN